MLQTVFQDEKLKQKKIWLPIIYLGGFSFCYDKNTRRENNLRVQSSRLTPSLGKARQGVLKAAGHITAAVNREPEYSKSALLHLFICYSIHAYT